jgi:hypothetical protein
MTATGRLGTRDRNSEIVGAMLLPLGFRREAALMAASSVMEAVETAVEMASAAALDVV